MPALVPTLRTLLAQADAHFVDGRLGDALDAFDLLLERSQERADRATQVVARSMIARCLLRKRDVDGARTQLQTAALLIDPVHLESHGRYRAGLARLALRESMPEVAREELRAYLQWAEEARAHPEVVDACLLLADQVDLAERDEELNRRRLEERASWIQRGIEHAIAHDVGRRLGSAYNDLAVALDQLSRPSAALEAYQEALVSYRSYGTRRQLVGAAWAVGSSACRLEDWPLARARLEEAIEGAERAEDCPDLLALALVDLALVHEASGDVVDARRLVIRAVALAREQGLSQVWPARWTAMLDYARSLDLEIRG